MGLDWGMFGNVRDTADKDQDTFPVRQPVSNRKGQTTQLLERDTFLASLSADLASATAGDGRTVLVSGEAGIGKTSLLEHFVRAHPAARVLWGACEALFTPHPLGPLHDLARQSSGRLRTLLGDGSDRAVLFSAVFDELAAAPTPTLLILEDIQWADAATLDLIKFLGRRVHHAPALMILSYRDDELDSTNLLRSTLGHLPSRHVTRLALPRLSPTAVALLAGAATRRDDDLYAVTGGNPFFVTEVLANPDGSVPATVRDAVLARASNLKCAARDVLELASVVPRAIETWLIESLLAAPVEALEECVASGLLLAEACTLRFRHELARVAVAESIPRQRIRFLHAKVLAALERSSEVISLARLVHHADLAEDSAAVLRLAPLAAREAASRGARREAAAHCRMALTLAYKLSDGDRAALLDDYASHCFELDDLANAIRARETAIELFGRTGDLARQSEALSRHALPLVRALRNADADAASQRAIAIAATLPPGPRLGSALATEAYLRMLNRDYADAIAWGHKAIALAEQHDDRETLAVAYNCVGAALLFVDYARGCDYLQTGLKIAGTLADGGVRSADAYAMLGAGSGEVYQFAIADRFLTEGVAFARARDLDRLADYMEAWQATVNMYRGCWKLADEQALQYLHCQASPDRLMALVALGRLRTRRGSPGADEALDMAQDLADRAGTLQRVAPVRCARAEVAWLAGDLARVRREARAAFELACDQGHPWFVGELAYWLWRTGDLKCAPAACAEPFALQIGGHWREAAAAWEKIGCPYEQARALADGDETAQREALVIFDRLGAGPMADRLRQQMRAAGVRAVPRGPRASTRGNSAGLTAREVQVLALVANGWQNARIAERLSRSPRTVEHHLAGILSKLDACSRNEAVARARARGIIPQHALAQHAQPPERARQIA
jgi:DNA-binding CsgD family transcriptional regulator